MNRPELEKQPVSLVETNAALEASVTGLNGQVSMSVGRNESRLMIYRSSRYLERQLRRLAHLEGKQAEASSIKEKQYYRKRSNHLIYVLLRRSYSLYIQSTVLTLSKAGSPGLGEDLTKLPITKRTMKYIRDRVLERLFKGQVCQSTKRV